MSKLFKGAVTCSYLSLSCFRFSTDTTLQPYQSPWTKWSLPEKKNPSFNFSHGKSRRNSLPLQIKDFFSYTKTIKITLKLLSQIFVHFSPKSQFVLSVSPSNEVCYSLLSQINSHTEGYRKGQRWAELKWHLNGTSVKCWPFAQS